MNKFMKLVPVALGLLTLASCSDDSFISEKNQQGSVTLEKGEMLVTMEEPQEDGSAFTRGYTSRDMKQRRWWSGIDKLMVYGSQFGAFDTYMFTQGVNETSGKFKIISTPSYVATPKWALFPEEQISNGVWDLVGGMYNSASTVDVDLPQTIEYDAAYDAANYENDKQPYYLDNLPRWGEVTSTNNGEYLSTSLNWLTGILRLQLAGTPDYANGVKIQLLEAGDINKALHINGTFTVKIAQNDVMIPTACITADGDISNPKGAYAVDADVDGAIYVYIPKTDKLVGADKNKSVIYLPLPVWDKQVDIVISMAPDYDGSEDGGTATWTPYKTLKDKTIQKGKVYGNKDEYNLALDGTTPEAITDALEMIETDAETITLKANNPIVVCAGDNNTVIEIPNKEGVKNIILDLSNGLDACSSSETLKIVYKDSGDKFQGNVMLITSDVCSSGYTVNLDVDLDKSGFGIANGKALDKMDIDATEFVIGDGTIATNLSYAKITLSDNVTALTVAEKGKITDPITIDDSKFKNVATVTVNGEVAGAINAANKVVNITVEGDDAVVTGDINTKGTVDISSKKDTFGGAITADGAITVTDKAVIAGAIESKESTVSLSGEATAGAAVKAKGNISIIEKANAIVGEITSAEGDITISNTAEFTYAGNVKATKGNVTLTSTKAVEFAGTVSAKKDLTVSGKVSLTNATAAEAGQDVILSGEASTKDVKAGRDYSVTENAKTDGAVSLKRAATVNITTKGGDAEAVTGTMTFAAGGSDFALNLLSGYVHEVDATQGEVKLTFAEEGAFAAIASVITPANLKPQNTSVWNGKQMTVAGYKAVDVNNFTWTASQLAYQINTPANFTLQSNIDLDNQNWAGITLGDDPYEINGNYKTISNLKLKGNKGSKTAGFINTAAKAVTISSLTFDGVQTDVTTISGGAYDGGIGAVIGRLETGATLTRVIVKLAGDNFGSKTDKNIKTANVGGLIGTTGWANLTGVQVDASATTLTGYKCIGGFIGRAYDDVTIKMAEEDGDDPEVFPTVTGLKMYVTFDATEGGSEVNDPYQGTTGQFIGFINLAKDITIADVTNVKPTLSIAGKVNEAAAFKIQDTTHRYFFGRGDQTLIGQSGFELPGTLGTIKINDKQYEVFKTGVPFTVGSPKLYELTNEPHVN